MADPTEDIVRREVARARRILQEDGHRVELRSLRERFDKHFPEESPEEEGKPKPPPANPPKDPAPEKKGGIWWAAKDE